MDTPRILIADEDSELLSVLALHLRNEEYDVVCATEGLEVLEVAHRTHPHVLVVNVSMPAGERHYLHQRLAEHPDLLAIPVLYLVGKRASRAGATLKLPAQLMIRKPVATSELLEKIASLLHAPASDIEPQAEAA